MKKKNKVQDKIQNEIVEQFTQLKDINSIASNSDLNNRVIDLGEVERTKYFSNKIKLSSHNDLVRMHKLEDRKIATILEKAIACYKKHHHPDLV